MRHGDGKETSGQYAGTETHLDAGTGKPTVLFFIDDGGWLVAVPMHHIERVDVAEPFDDSVSVIGDVTAILAGHRQIEGTYSRSVAEGTHCYLEVVVTRQQVACEGRCFRVTCDGCSRPRPADAT